MRRGASFALVVACTLLLALAHGRRVLEGAFNGSRRRLAALKRAPLVPVVRSAAEHRVEALPGLRTGSGVEQYAGLLSVAPDRSGMLFYWLFKRPKNQMRQKKRLVIWCVRAAAVCVMIAGFNAV